MLVIIAMPCLLLQLGPFIFIYDTTTSPWTKMANPSYVPDYSPDGLAINNSGTRCAITLDMIATGYMPYLCVYDTTTSPWTKIADPDTLYWACMCVDFNNDGSICAVGNSSPGLILYNTTTSPWTKMTDVADQPNYCKKIAFNPAGNKLVATQNSNPYNTVYNAPTSNPYASKTNGQTRSTPKKYGIAKATVSANSDVSVDIILNN